MLSKIDYMYYFFLIICILISLNFNDINYNDTRDFCKLLMAYFFRFIH